MCTKNVGTIGVGAGSVGFIVVVMLDHGFTLRDAHKEQRNGSAALSEARSELSVKRVGLCLWG